MPTKWKSMYERKALQLDRLVEKSWYKHRQIGVYSLLYLKGFTQSTLDIQA